MRRSTHVRYYVSRRSGRAKPELAPAGKGRSRPRRGYLQMSLVAPRGGWVLRHTPTGAFPNREAPIWQKVPAEWT